MSISDIENKKYKEIVNTNYGYPKVNDEDLLGKLYKKREFYYNKTEERTNLKTYEDEKI